MAIVGVLDTNIVLYEFANQLAQPLPDGTYAVSVITYIELLSYPSLTSAEEYELEDFLSGAEVIDLTPEIRNATIRLRRRHRLKLPDAIIAGTAMSLGVDLLTSDRRLARTPGLRCRLIQMRGS
jgi:predicted nucleic acid-binding protein